MINLTPQVDEDPVPDLPTILTEDEVYTTLMVDRCPSLEPIHDKH